MLKTFIYSHYYMLFDSDKKDRILNFAKSKF